MMSKKAENKNEKLNQKTKVKKSIQMQEDSDMSDDLDGDEEMDSEIKMVFLEESNRRRQREAKSLFVDNLPKHASRAQIKSLSEDVKRSVHFSKGKTRSAAVLHFESEEKAEENFKLLNGKTFKDRILSVNYMGYKAIHFKPYPKSYDMKTLLLPFLPFDCTVHEVAQHFPSCSQVLLEGKSLKHALINFQEKQDADTVFLANKSVNIKDIEIPVLHGEKRQILSDGPDADKRFIEEIDNRGGCRGRFGGSPIIRGGTRGHIDFRGGGFGRGFIARGSGFRGAELGGGRGFSPRERGLRGAERGSRREFRKDGPDAGGRFKEQLNNRGGFRGRFVGSPIIRGGSQRHIGFRGGRSGFGRGFIARGSGFRVAELDGGRGFFPRGRGIRGAERGRGFIPGGRGIRGAERGNGFFPRGRGIIGAERGSGRFPRGRGVEKRYFN